MELLTDLELDQILRRWQAPAAPERLNSKVLGHLRPQPWWRFLLTGSIRVPVPAGLAIVGLLLLLTFAVFNARPRRLDEHPTLGDFKPIRHLQPRILRSTYEIQ